MNKKIGICNCNLNGNSLDRLCSNCGGIPPGGSLTSGMSWDRNKNKKELR